MIKQKDVIGALIVLSSYFFLTPVSFLSFFAIAPFLIGVVISKRSLASHANKRWAILYQKFAIGILVVILSFLWIVLDFLWIAWDVIIIMIYAIPALVASLSLTMSHFAKDNAFRPKKKEGTPF